jgi:predicted nucleic acid-binding protein
VRILNHERFDFVAGEKILEEVKRSSRYRLVERKVERRVKIFKYLNYGEILRPFFSVEEIEKGEHEVIAISCILYVLGSNFLAIIDEDQARKFLRGIFPEAERRTTGTVGFVEECYRYGVFSREEAISILESMKSSKFRVKKEIIEGAIRRVREGSRWLGTSW